MSSQLPLGLVVTGPTCSGKSSLALQIAKQFNGVVINADSMQVYKELRILTARPSEEEEASIPHKLYGVLDSTVRQGNAAWWVEQATDILKNCLLEHKTPIITGGTGMYLKSLFEGLSPVPTISPEVRERVRNLGKEEGSLAVKKCLGEVDPQSAERIEDADMVRLCRALEVWEETKKPLSWWRGQTKKPDTGFRYLWVHLDPPKLLLNNRVRERLNIMVKQGAIEEVEKLKRLGLTDEHPLMRAHGVPEFIRYIDGKMNLQEAVDKAASNVARYTKRQRTWFRHHSLGEDIPRFDIESRITPSNDILEGEQEVEKAFKSVYSFCIENNFKELKCQVKTSRL